MLAYVVDKPLKDVDPHIDLLEIRFDHCDFFLPKKNKWILTIRRKRDGGLFIKSEKDRLQLFEKLLQFKPDYVDLESDVPLDFAKKMKRRYPRVKLIRSFHDFEKTPHDLEGLFLKMHHPIFDLYKIATFANSSLDALKMMTFVQNAEHAISGICMGYKGAITRLGPLFGSAIDYTSNAPINGQISLDALINLYRYPNITKKTKLFALIGNPLTHSIGHLFHNEYFQKIKKDALYVKIPLEKNELSDFFSLIKSLPFLGLSITTPLKEEMQKYCRSKGGPVNTLTLKDQEWHGENTDGKGAMLSLKKKGKLQGKRVLVLGAGATAKTIVLEGINNALCLTVFNRDYEKAKRAFHPKVKVLKTLVDADHFDIVINATSCGMKDDASPVTKKWLKSHLIILDAVYKHAETTLVKEAREKKCTVLSGHTLFSYQALLQQEIWRMSI